MLDEAFENVAPYISNLREIKKFVEDNKNRDIKETMEIIDKRILSSPPDLATDFRILQNELRKMINTEM